MLSPTERREKAFMLADATDVPASASCFARSVVNMMEVQARDMAQRLISSRCLVKNGTVINPIIKPVGDCCNLRCRYCFNFPGQQMRVMSDDTLELIVMQSLELSPSEISFIMHGGEPLLAGLPFFKRLLDLQARYKKPGQVIHNGVTTNGTLLNEAWCNFLKENKFGVAISLDGPAEVHDRNRIFADGSGSFAYVLEGIKRAQNAGIPLTLLAVVGAASRLSAHGLYSFMKSLEVSSWRANPCRERAEAASYAVYVEELFEEWCNDGCQVTIGIINEIIRGLFGYKVRDCWMSGGCRKNIGFEPDGTVSPCCEISIGEEYLFGNIHDMPLETILKSPPAQKFWLEREIGNSRCQGCEWSDLCAGGCTFQRIEQNGTPAGKDYMCHMYRDVFKNITTKVDSLLTAPSKAAA